MEKEFNVDAAVVLISRKNEASKLFFVWYSNNTDKGSFDLGKLDFQQN